MSFVVPWSRGIDLDFGTRGIDQTSGEVICSGKVGPSWWQVANGAFGLS